MTYENDKQLVEIIKLNVVFDFTQEAIDEFESNENRCNEGIQFQNSDGRIFFLKEYKSKWYDVLKDAVTELLPEYPLQVQNLKYQEGSCIIGADIAIEVKSIIENFIIENSDFISKIIHAILISEIIKLKDKILKKLNSEGKKLLPRWFKPKSVFEIKSFKITPAFKMIKSDSLWIAVSPSHFLIANLENEAMQNIYIALFIGDTEQSHCSSDAYINEIEELVPNQLICKKISDFEHGTDELHIGDLSVYIKCLIHDRSKKKIHLFKFHLNNN